MPNTVGLCSAAKVAICNKWSAVTVSPASANAKTRNFVALDSKMSRLGGNSHLTGHASPVSAVADGGAKSAGKGTKATSQWRGLLMRRSLSLSDSSPFFLRDGVTNASRRARTE